MSEPLPKMQWAIAALAQPAEIQLALFPDFACKADELALNFEDGLYELVGRERHVSAEQRTAINHLDSLVRAMSGEQNSEFWTEEALRSHETWNEIRTRAKLVASAFGWSVDVPPPTSGIYISEG